MINKDYRRIIILSAGIVLLFSVIAAFLFGRSAFLPALAMGALLLSVFAHYTKKRFEKIGELNRYLARVLAGDYDLEIAGNEEGELSILQNNICKATVMLKEKNELLEKEKAYLADMLANISHQMKTPLTSVMMMNELLSAEGSEEKRREFLDIEEKQLEKMNWLIRTLLKLSRLDAGTVTLKAEKVAASKLVEETLAPFLLQMDVKEIAVSRHTDDTEFFVDKNWTVEALQNIVKNCIEHMGPGGRLMAETKENNLYKMIRITDTGCGISEEDLPHIFDRFYRGKDSSADSVGIGLSLSRTIIEKQRGDILVESKAGQGTTFEIRFYKAII